MIPAVGRTRLAQRTDRDLLAGSAYGIGAALSFGVVVVVQRSLAKEDLPVATVVGGRYFIASVLLITALAASRRPLLPVPGERLRAFLLGLVGYVIHSSLFYLALGHGTAAAVSMLFYLYPAVIAVIELAGRLRPLNRRSVTAPVLSALGVMVVITAGQELSVTPLGVGLALIASVAVSCYLLASSRLIRRSNPIATGAFVAAGVAVSMSTGGTLLSGFSLPGDAFGRLLLAGLATAGATACVYATLLRLGAGATAAFMALQSLVALVIAGITLHEPITFPQVVGGVALVAGAALASSSRTRIVDAAE
jgi:drug/metabolite transporter (DMT)-like permease